MPWVTRHVPFVKPREPCDRSWLLRVVSAVLGGHRQALSPALWPGSYLQVCCSDPFLQEAGVQWVSSFLHGVMPGLLFASAHLSETSRVHRSDPSSIHSGALWGLKVSRPQRQLSFSSRCSRITRTCVSCLLATRQLWHSLTSLGWALPCLHWQF